MHFLYEPGEAEVDHKNRVTVPIWSVTTHTVEKVVVKPKQPILYYVSGRRRSYVREELHTNYLMFLIPRGIKKFFTQRVKFY